MMILLAILLHHYLEAYNVFLFIIHPMVIHGTGISRSSQTIALYKLVGLSSLPAILPTPLANSGLAC